MKNGTIAVIGLGNVGHHLTNALAHNSDFQLFVFTKKNTAAQKEYFSEPVNFLSQKEMHNILPRFCFLTVQDDKIVEATHALPENWKKRSTIIHTSGIHSFDLLKKHCNSYGLFYPLNSFSKKIPFDWHEVPVFIDASKQEDKIALKNLAQSLGARALDNDDKTREHLHLTAVMVNNFTNHWFGLADNYLKNKDIPFNYLLPLIRTTVQKLNFDSPEKMQTGPAIRGDVNTIKKHLALIKDEELEELYRKMSESINPSLKNKIK